MTASTWLGIVAWSLGAVGGAKPAVSPSASHRQAVIVVVGAAGAEDYEPMFSQWTEKWRDAARRGSAEITTIGADAEAGGPDRDQLVERLTKDRSRDFDLLWLVFIGHGTYDGRTARFNLRGPDISADELANWLAPIKTPLVIVNCASASGPFVNRLSGAGRVVVTAAKSGDEVNFARFGGYFADAVDDPQADLDKDDQTSLLEAYLTACRQTVEFYEGQRRLATEHALLDDNGDGAGTPATWFRGLRATRKAENGASLDGVRAHQIHLVPSDREARMPSDLRKRRDALELKIAALRDEKASLDEAEYYRVLEPLMLELARLYAASNGPAESR